MTHTHRKVESVSVYVNQSGKFGLPDSYLVIITTMLRTPVISSNLQSVGYDSSSKVLEVEFTNGSVYQYSNVPKLIYVGLMNATSHGKFFHAYVKNTYPHSQVRLKIF